MNKNFIKIIAVILMTFAMKSYAFASTIITVPIDSRPISNEYLGNLARIAGDNLISSDKKNLDYFSAKEENNYFADSNKVREELEGLVKQNNNKDTTVIINTSSYITKGLVGSRCGINYVDYEEALNDLYRLISENTEPTYYINLSMPRTLPETRFNDIWRTDRTLNDSLKGLGYYYLKYNKDTELKDYIIKNLSIVNPSQFLLEWSYVENKKNEIGEENLSQWEKEFIEVFNSKYKSVEPYKSYLYYYKLPYQSVASIFGTLLKWQDKGLLDEIVISNDDYQLPNSVLYFYNNTEADWINTENGNPIKYSFARPYMTTNSNSIYKQLVNKRSPEEAENAMKGLGENVNFIFGTDEIPQLIYARDLSKRKNLTTDINTITSNTSNEIARFDVIGINELLKNDINFVNYSKNKTNKKFDLFMYDYNNISDSKVTSTLKNMNNSYNEKHNVGLIEIYSEKLLNTGENTLFKNLFENGYNHSENLLSIADLSSYSAWNTNANAIGLGVAHTQVYGIAEQSSKSNKENLMRAQINVLSQHILEDGIYTIQTKRQLSNEKFIPSESDIIKSEKLYNLISVDKMGKIFTNKKYYLDDELYNVNSWRLTDYNFPWGRTFECYLNIDADITFFGENNK